MGNRPVRDRAVRVNEAAKLTNLSFIVVGCLGRTEKDGPIPKMRRGERINPWAAACLPESELNVCSSGSPRDKMSILGEEAKIRALIREAETRHKRGRDYDFQVLRKNRFSDDDADIGYAGRLQI